MKITRRSVLTGGTAFAAAGFNPLIGKQGFRRRQKE